MKRARWVAVVAAVAAGCAADETGGESPAADVGGGSGAGADAGPGEDGGDGAAGGGDASPGDAGTGGDAPGSDTTGEDAATDAGGVDDGGGADVGDAGGDTGEADTAPALDGEGDGEGDGSDDAITFSDDPLEWAVDHDGPYPVGYRVLETTYQPPGGVAPRTIEVHVWYPATEAVGANPTYLGLFPDPKVFTDAPKAESPYPAGHPVLVHSHGHMGFAGNSAELMRYVASHGWVAVAPEHKGNTLTDTPEVRPLELYLERPLDLRAALDHVLALDAPDALAGTLDVDHVGMSGHSFGTYTMWAIGGATIDPQVVADGCEAGSYADCTADLQAAMTGDLTDPRARVLIPMAGSKNALFGATGLTTVTLPVFLMSGSLDDVGAPAVLAEVAGKVDLTWVEVEGGCHQLFGLGNAVLGDAACKALPDAEGFAIVDTLLLAALRYHVLDDHSDEVAGIVEGTVSVSPLVTWTKAE